MGRMARGGSSPLRRMEEKAPHLRGFLRHKACDGARVLARSDHSCPTAASHQRRTFSLSPREVLRTARALPEPSHEPIHRPAARDATSTGSPIPSNPLRAPKRARHRGGRHDVWTCRSGARRPSTWRRARRWGSWTPSPMTTWRRAPAAAAGRPRSTASRRARTPPASRGPGARRASRRSPRRAARSRRPRRARAPRPRAAPRPRTGARTARAAVPSPRRAPARSRCGRRWRASAGRPQRRHVDAAAAGPPAFTTVTVPSGSRTSAMRSPPSAQLWGRRR